MCGFILVRLALKVHYVAGGQGVHYYYEHQRSSKDLFAVKFKCTAQSSSYWQRIKFNTRRRLFYSAIRS